MDQHKTDISVCLGSSCFARGNKKLVQVIQQFLKQYHLEEQVIFHGAHCFGKCGEGPMIRIGEEWIHSQDPDEVTRLLKNHFGL